MAPSKTKQPFTEALIQEVQAHSSIWDIRSNEHKDLVINSNAWRSILANLRDSYLEEDLAKHQLNSEEDLRSHWRNLRDTYRRQKQFLKAKSGSGQKKKKEWVFFQMLRFLDNSGAEDFETANASSFVNLREDEDQDSDQFSIANDPGDVSRPSSPGVGEHGEDANQVQPPAGKDLSSFLILH